MSNDTSNYNINIPRNVRLVLPDKHCRMQGEKQDLHMDAATFCIFNDLVPPTAVPFKERHIANVLVVYSR